ncbi:hypothetical protein C8R47DRAFT_572400 [Mycena vitilis]|nr:hypothetical protein C8R47DRAFT_572400 [Mycena vitilis]
MNPMSSTEAKQCFSAIGIHRVPPHLSKKDFETKLEALVEGILIFPSVQAKVLKFEMIVQNDVLDEHVGLFAFPAREPAVAIAIRTKTTEDLEAVRFPLRVFAAPKIFPTQVLGDAAVQALFRKAEESGVRPGHWLVPSYVTRKIESSVPAQDMVHIIGVYNVPPDVSVEEYSQKFHVFVDKYVALAAVQKNLVNYDLWELRSATNGEDPAPHAAFVVRANSETLQNTLEYLNDAEAQSLVQKAKQDFEFNTSAWLFTADVASKIDRA